LARKKSASDLAEKGTNSYLDNEKERREIHSHREGEKNALKNFAMWGKGFLPQEISG